MTGVQTCALPISSFLVISLCHSYYNDLILCHITVSLLFFSWASLAHLLSLGFLNPFTNFAFPWAFTNFIGLPCLNYLILILGVHRLAINPLLSLFVLLWACSGPFSLFYIIYCPWVCYFTLSGLL